MIDEEYWKVVEKRAERVSDNIRIGILGNLYSKQELLEEVRNRSDVGRIYAEMQKEFTKFCLEGGLSSA